MSSILPSRNRARRRLNFGDIDGFLVIKLVKPIKILCSRTPYKTGVGQLLLSQAKSNIRTAAAGVLREADATVRQEVCRLDSSDRVLDQIAKFRSLLVGNRSS